MTAYLIQRIPRYSVHIPQQFFYSFSIDSNSMNAFAQDNDEIRFAEETEVSLPESSWKILIVDDEVEVHRVTQLALRDFTFEDKALNFISAYSAQEAKQLLQAHPDIAIIFLDVVMETEDAGLELIKYVRDELDNPYVRIILRTGQPGRAPEDKVAVNYGIDDYKTKTELTAQKLFISVMTGLRAYSTLLKVLNLNHSLESEIIQHKQTELALRISEMDAIAKVQQLEQTLQALRKTLVQPELQKNLDHLSAEVTETIPQLLNQENPLQTMAIITRIARTVIRLTEEQAAKLGISQTKLTVLLYLNGEPDLCASPSSLAKHCGVSRAAMTGLLDGLEQDGYVERDTNPSDRRALMIKLTEKGQQFLDRIPPQDQDQLAELVDTLSAIERNKLNELAVKLMTIEQAT